MSDLRINISRLSEGLHSFPLESEPGALGLDERFGSTVRVLAAIEKTSRQMVLSAEVSTEGTFACDRCLDSFSLPLSTRYTIAYVQGERVAPENQGEEEVAHEVQVIAPEASVIDLGEDVRQFLLLSVPVKLLCKEDCAGLCPRCGVNWNRESCSCAEEETDPRWESLRRLRKN